MIYIRRTREYSLHLGANNDQIKKAKSFRHEMTEAERILWNEIKSRKLNGLKFRRQHPIHYYIADFYCHEKKLIIEVDGGVHESEETRIHDGNRTAEFEKLGIRVLRFTNEKILHSLNEVTDTIREATADRLE